MELQKFQLKRLVVIGGGAAGFFCAINAAAANADLQVTILEKTSKLLSKVRISGGGRCNATHACFDIGEMSRKYPRGGNFVKKTFHQFFTTDTIQWFEDRGVNLKTEADGRMFPVSDSSQSIIDCLIKETNRYQISIRMNTDVTSLEKVDGEFRLELSGNSNISCDYVCVATGGYPKTAMFDWIKKIGLTIEDPVPSLFTFNLPQHSITSLMGVSVSNAQVKIVGSSLAESGPLLITHWGLSGPAVLKLSAWGAREFAKVGYRFQALVNWVYPENEAMIKEKFQQIRSNNGSQRVMSKNDIGLPNRLWDYLCSFSGVTSEMRWADLPAKIQNSLVKNVCSFPVEISGKTTFKEEFVTAGGVLLNEVDVNSMQSKQVPGLFFAGEVLNVDGVTGGFNFQHAWTSAWIAARAIARHRALP